MTKRRGRRCGQCSTCCTSLDVPEQSAPAGTPCVHQSSDGCMIYRRRPEVCRGFRCGWLSGLGQGLDRPDRLGLLLTKAHELRPDPGAPILAVQVNEHRDGAADTERGRALLDQLERRYVVLLVRYDGTRRTTGPLVPLTRVLRALGADMDKVSVDWRDKR